MMNKETEHREKNIFPAQRKTILSDTHAQLFLADNPPLSCQIGLTSASGSLLPSLFLLFVYAGALAFRTHTGRLASAATLGFRAENRLWHRSFCAPHPFKFCKLAQGYSFPATVHVMSPEDPRTR